MSDTVLVLGGGVAGMSAAHELAERGYSVTVLEDRAAAGGKARSIPVPRSGKGGRADLPAEHGFRFFPGFYRHLPDTMKRIPFADNADGVFGNLREATEAEIARTGKQTPLRLPVRFPYTLSDLTDILRDVTRGRTDLTPADVAYFSERLLVLLTSCKARRFGEWENQSWWEFSGAVNRSPAYQRFLADGLTRSLVAAQAREMSARTGGYTLLQLLFDMSIPGRGADRLLNGPTNDVWIFPWLSHLQSLKVDYRFRHRVEAIDCRDGRIASVTAVGPGGKRLELRADWYVAALPVENMAHLTTPELRQAEPRLEDLDKLQTRWMNGIVFYLHEDVPIVHGHVIYIDSEWALTSISQRQFWTDSLTRFGDGSVGGILSVDVSDWTTPGPVTGKAAMHCSRHEISKEVWTQLQASLNRHGETLSDGNLLRWFLDTDVHFPDLQRRQGLRDDINLEPLLVNTAGSWAWRPEAVTSVENLFLASDYVRTHTDLATMEGANEAARRAVNGILQRSGSKESPCGVWHLFEPAIFAPARWIDKLRYEHGKGHELPANLGRAERSGSP